MLGERIAESRKRAGLLQVDLAVALGDPYDQSVISRIEAGQRPLRPEGIANAARELRVSTDYLLGLTDDPTPYAELAERLTRLDALEHEIRGPSDLYDSTAITEEGGGGLDPASTRYVEIHEVEAAAGTGRLIEGAPVKGRLAFQRTWLSQHNIDPNHATVISVAGDSMEPTLPEGCSILVDHRRRARRKGRIYVLQTEDTLMVKRAGRDKSGWQLISDNPYWPVVPWAEDTDIIGEVRWVARTF